MTPTGLEARDAAAAAVAVRPRVTLDQVQSLVQSERYFVDDDFIICVLTLKNGFKVTGESRAADPANFNETLGRKIAREKAVSEIWPLAGYMLRDTLHRGENPAVMRCKVVLNGRMHAYTEAPRDKDGRPPGRHIEQPFSYKDHRGEAISGVRYTPDATDPANIVLDGENLHFHAVIPAPCDPNGTDENLIFGHFTPSFYMQAHVRNRGVLERLKQGQAYYIDFIPVPTIAEGSGQGDVKDQKAA